MAKIRIQLSPKHVFEREYDKSDAVSVRNMVMDYLTFYNGYRSTHTISAKRWHFPSVVIDGENMYRVTPNGSWYDEKLDRKVF